MTKYNFYKKDLENNYLVPLWTVSSCFMYYSFKKTENYELINDAWQYIKAHAKWLRSKHKMAAAQLRGSIWRTLRRTSVGRSLHRATGDVGGKADRSTICQTPCPIYKMLHKLFIDSQAKTTDMIHRNVGALKLLGETKHSSWKTHGLITNLSGISVKKFRVTDTFEVCKIRHPAICKT